MKKYKIANSLKFIFTGWITYISEKRWSSNKLGYQIIRCCSYRDEWCSFIIYDDVIDLSQLKIGQFLKLQGSVKIDWNNNIYLNPKFVEILSKIPAIERNPNLVSEKEEIEYNEKI